MGSGKTELPELELHATDGKQSPADFPLAESPNTPAGKRAPGKGRDATISKLLERIHAANAAMDPRESVPVTVIVPAYLKGSQDLLWLYEAIDSVLDQTVLCKCIIVENGSSYLPDLVGQISIIHSEKGLPAARNAGIKASDTEFFFPLDCNDWLPDYAIETVYTKRPEKGFLYGATMLFAQERGIGDQILYEAKPYDFEEIKKMVYFPNGALQRRADWEKIGGYRESLPFLEDWDYWMTAGELGICGNTIPDVIYWYRQHGGMVGTNRNTPEWEKVKKLIQGYHRQIYRGVYPPMCCGNKARSQTPYIPPTQQELAPGEDGMIKIQYIGGNAGDMPFYGPVSGARYRAGGVTKLLWIDERDALTGIRSQPGFLEMVDHGAPLFERVES